jgi:hypothetical protein
MLEESEEDLAFQAKVTLIIDSNPTNFDNVIALDALILLNPGIQN